MEKFKKLNRNEMKNVVGAAGTACGKSCCPNGYKCYNHDDCCDKLVCVKVEVGAAIGLCINYNS